MGYVQMTINDWLEVKHKLKMELQGVKQSFVRIGYVLRKIDDQRLYENDGYKSITEFAKGEYGLEASTVSRFMSINREYSINGYSEHLREEYLDMGRSQLEEMLKLPEKDREMIRPETSREDIRDLKRFNKTEPAAGVADDIYSLIEKFYEANEEVLNELYREDLVFTESPEKLAEIVNPGGNRSFKKGIFFLMMYEENIKIKKFGSEPQTMSWEEFFVVTRDIFVAAGPNTYKNHFSKSDKNEEENNVEVQIPGQMEIKDYPEILPDKSEEKEEIAPAQKSKEPLKTLNEQGISKPQKREKTEDEKYEEQQRKIDRETKKKLQEKEDEKKMEVLPSEMEKPVHQIRLATMYFDDVVSGKKSFELRKNDRNYKVGDILEMLEFNDGRHTGRTVKAEVTYMLEDYTGLTEGYCILATKVLEGL